MRLWTIHCADAWAAAQRRGVLRADGRRITLRDLRPAYRWLMDQMRCRLSGYAGRYPVWAWSAPKPDLRWRAHLPPGTPGVRVEFVAPADAVLLSDFDAWHIVLARDYLALTEEEDEAWEGRARAATGMDFPRFEALPSDLQAEVRASWERIFDLDALNAAPLWHADRNDTQFVQAVLEEVRLDQVVRVTPFVAR